MYDCIVIGGGAAGVMASIVLSKNNINSLLIEKNSELLNKVKISGNSRCNITNLKDNRTFLDNIPKNSKFLYSTLNNFNPKSIDEFFTSRGVSLKVEDNDRVFPSSDKSTDVVNTLINELKSNNANINYNETVLDIKQDEVITVITDKNTYSCKNLIIATGGMTYPKTGSTGDGYNFAKNINQNLTPIYPVETSLVSKYKFDLAGVSLQDINIILNKKIFSGDLLFTHVGVSGPAVFKASEFVYHELKKDSEVKIYIDLCKNYSFDDIKNSMNIYNTLTIFDFLNEYTVKRLAQLIIKNYDLLNTDKICTISKNKLNNIIETLKRFEIIITDTGNIETAFVTGGGVDIKYIEPKTMESKINKNIYFVGEVLDVHGSIGGYNLTICMSTGYTAALDIINKKNEN